MIRASPIRLIDEDNEMIGVVETPEALRQAREAGLDLVEVASDSEPPVCRILDYGKYKYEQAKKDKANKARSKTAEMKEVRLGRSMKIDPHDIQIRLNQARRFLMDGHKVNIVQNFRGREMMHRHRGMERMNDIVKQLEDIAKLEVPPRQTGRRMMMTLAPDKPKIEQIKRRLESAKDKSPAKGKTGNVDPDPQPAPPPTIETASDTASDTGATSEAAAKTTPASTQNA